MVERKGRVLRRVHLEQSTTVFFMKPYVPDAVVQAARNPLSNQIASLFCLHEVLIAVYVRDVPESLSFDLITDWMSAEGNYSIWCYTHSSTCAGTCVG